MSSFADYFTNWTQLVAAINENAEELSFLTVPNANLEAVTSGARSLSTKQATLKAELTQTTKDLNTLLRNGKDLSSRLRSAVRGQLGLGSEKLLAFRIRPRRTRSSREETAAGGGVTTPPPTTE